MMPPAAPKAVRHPLLAALDRAPVGEPFTPEERAELDERAEELLSGRVVGVRNEDVPAWLEAHARELGELDK